MNSRDSIYEMLATYLASEDPNANIPFSSNTQTTEIIDPDQSVVQRTGTPELVVDRILTFSEEAANATMQISNNQAASSSSDLEIFSSVPGEPIQTAHKETEIHTETSTEALVSATKKKIAAGDSILNALIAKMIVVSGQMKATLKSLESSSTLTHVQALNHLQERDATLIECEKQLQLYARSIADLKKSAPQFQNAITEQINYFIQISTFLYDLIAELQKAISSLEKQILEEKITRCGLILNEIIDKINKISEHYDYAISVYQILSDTPLVRVATTLFHMNACKDELLEASTQSLKAYRETITNFNGTKGFERELCSQRKSCLQIEKRITSLTTLIDNAIFHLRCEVANSSSEAVQPLHNMAPNVSSVMFQPARANLNMPQRDENRQRGPAN